MKAGVLIKVLLSGAPVVSYSDNFDSLRVAYKGLIDKPDADIKRVELWNNSGMVKRHKFNLPEPKKPVRKK
jgi:hypothetical protein